MPVLLVLHSEVGDVGRVLVDEILYLMKRLKGSERATEKEEEGDRKRKGEESKGRSEE